jgi:hypothetical protein
MYSTHNQQKATGLSHSFMFCDYKKLLENVEKQK